MHAREHFTTMPAVLQVAAPVVIIGDIHGQLFDLFAHFDAVGWPSDTTSTRYLFLGDYVDRGKNSLETVCLLLALSIKHPTKVFLLRGNHECASINRIYGFYDDCKRRFSIKLWKNFTDVFNWMPIVAVVSSRVLCMHGGLSPLLRTLEQLDDIPRPADPEKSVLVNDILWSDPATVSPNAAT